MTVRVTNKQTETGYVMMKKPTGITLKFIFAKEI